jgi:hypothetical protein
MHPGRSDIEGFKGLENLDPGETYSFTGEQLAMFIRGSVGIANELYTKMGTGNDEAVYRETIMMQMEGLLVERELVRRGIVKDPKHQLYPLP